MNINKKMHTFDKVVDYLAMFAAVPSFGCSDCRCPSHLFFSPTRAHLLSMLESEPRMSHFLQQQPDACGLLRFPAPRGGLSREGSTVR